MFCFSDRQYEDDVLQVLDGHGVSFGKENGRGGSRMDQPPNQYTGHPTDKIYTT